MDNITGNLESQRLRLRRFHEGDLENMNQLESDAEVMKFTPARTPFTAKQSQERLTATIEKEVIRAPLGIWAIEIKDSKDFVGWIMLADTQKEFPELGFMVVRKHWKKGFAEEAARRLISYGFEDLGYPTILATTDHDNISSQNLLAKLGFKFSRTLKVPDKILNRESILHLFELHR